MVRRLLAVLLVFSAGLAYAQFPRGFGGYGGLRGEQGDPAELPPAEYPDRQLAGCHILYSSVRREANGSGWRTDYPWGQRNLLIRLSELTKTRVCKEAGIPHVWLVRLTDPALFECSFLMASDVGTIGLSDEEAAALRLYLLKGGFLWVDDFWGEAAWEQWSTEIAKALPPTQYPIFDIPKNHPIFHVLHQIDHVPQVTSIQNWRRSGGETSERGAESAEVHFRAIADGHGRIMVLMSHNTDLGDSWEREGEDPAFFYQFSPAGYSVGINVLLYTLSH